MNKIKLIIAALLVLSPFSATAGPIFSSASYTPDVSFTDGTSGCTALGLASTGNNYYTASGGSSSGCTYARYDASGALLAESGPTLDFRSLFTDSSGQLFARAFNNNIIYQETAFGTFAPFVTLVGATIDTQSSIVLNSDGTEYIARSGGTVQRFDLAGNFIANVILAGFGGDATVISPINQIGNTFLTYSGGNMLSAWDATTGAFLDSTSLVPGGSEFVMGAYADSRYWVLDATNTWNGYSIGLETTVPEPYTIALFSIGLAGLGWSRRKKA